MSDQLFIYVLDTNILLSDPKSIFAFGPHKVVLPIYVIEELDKFKKESNELGLHARQVVRLLDDLRSKGSLEQGITLDNGSILSVMCTMKTLPSTVGMVQNQDEKILSVAYALKDLKENLLQNNPQCAVVLVTNDINLRLRADSLGLQAEGFNNKKEEIDLHSGTPDLLLSSLDIDLLHSNGRLSFDCQSYDYNQYLTIKCIAGGQSSALVRVNKDNNSLDLLKKIPNGGVFGIKPRNKEQFYALDALLDDNIKLVTLAGIAGAGKDLLALSAGLHKVMEERAYNKISVAKPIVAFHNDIGYLPGTQQEKLQPWLRSIFDLLDQLIGASSPKGVKTKGRSYQELIDMNIVSVEALTYLRGCTLPGQWLLISEAQNLSPHELKTIITRVGENTKIILTGDIHQIDNHKLDAQNNGLTYVAERFKNNKVAAHITLHKSERSSLAEMAAKLL